MYAKKAMLYFLDTLLYSDLMSSEPAAKPRLNRQDWIDAAFETLTTSGVGAIVIDRLAGTLGVTRGSFYYHFRDRNELLTALLDFWANHWTFAVREQIAGLGLDPATTLLALMRAIRQNGAAEHDAPIRAWALHDPMAREVVQQVDAARLGFIRSQFEALGFEGIDAENRARLYLNFEMAAPAMFAAPDPETDEKLLVARHRFLTSR